MKKILLALTFLMSLSHSYCLLNENKIELNEEINYRGETKQSYENTLKYCIEGYSFLKIGNTRVQKMIIEFNSKYDKIMIPETCTCKKVK